MDSSARLTLVTFLPASNITNIAISIFQKPKRTSKTQREAHAYDSLDLYVTIQKHSTWRLYLRLLIYRRLPDVDIVTCNLGRQNRKKHKTRKRTPATPSIHQCRSNTYISLHIIMVFDDTERVYVHRSPEATHHASPSRHGQHGSALHHLRASQTWPVRSCRFRLPRM